MPKKVLGNISNLTTHINHANINAKNILNNKNRAVKRPSQSSPDKHNLKKTKALTQIGKGKVKDDVENENEIERAIKSNVKCESVVVADAGVDLTRTIEKKVRAINIGEKSQIQTGNVGKLVLDQSLLDEDDEEKEAFHDALEHIDFSNPTTYYDPPSQLPENVEDYDKSQINQIESEPHYANDIFRYYGEKEIKLACKKYMHNQTELSKGMRAVLVDWMVEVQESFELNHETLYLAVKIVDQYLMHEHIGKSKFQLLGATAILIAAKFDERIPPAIEDFLYICDDAYTRRDVILTEMNILRSINFYLGFPISYRFLRRFARCTKLTMETLTLSRYILETSLMEYELIEQKDSMMAAAALLLALKMKGQGDWNETLKFYSGYQEEDLLPLMYTLNDLISANLKFKTIKNKYSHKVFFEVAKISPLPKAVNNK